MSENEPVNSDSRNVMILAVTVIVVVLILVGGGITAALILKDSGGKSTKSEEGAKPAERKTETEEALEAFGKLVGALSSIDGSGSAMGETLTVDLGPQVNLEMVKIKAGSFTMGSPDYEAGRENDEGQHQVTLTDDYYLGKFEVTQAQWEAVMGSNPSSFKGANRPVENVSWHEAKEFCNKLNSLYSGNLPRGYQFDLPTEAQWEYACRAGTTTAYFWGNALNGDKANCNGNYPCGTETKGQYLQRTTDAGSYNANPWGLYDMHGNVWEWCRDWYGSYSGNARNPAGPAVGSSRVIRGGGWNDYCAGFCRAANRLSGVPGFRCNDLGFRLALVPVQ